MMIEFRRRLSTGDGADVSFSRGDTIDMMYAYGTVSAGGVIQQHTDRGVISVKIDNNMALALAISFLSLLGILM